MLGNTALDVVIGLVFIYLLYSLLGTVMMEMISSFLALRARNLRYALARMLMDEKTYNENTLKKAFFGILNSLVRVGGWWVNLEDKDLYNKFFKQPSIKYLGSGGLVNRPSYLSAENFSKALIDSIRHNDPDIPLLARFEIGLEKTKIGKETRAHLRSLLDDANNDLNKFKALLEQWYNDTMERATGWYKRSTQMILIAIGFVLAIAFNVDSIAIIKKLSTDKQAREQLVKMATDFSENNKALIEEVTKKDTATDPSVAQLNDRLNSLSEVKKKLEQDIYNSQSLLSSNWYLTDTLTVYSTIPKSIPANFKLMKHSLVNGKMIYLVVHQSIDPRVMERSLSSKLSSDEKTIKVKTFWYKVKYVFTSYHFFGYFLTVLALSLGAPFWFDLLNKLVKLRTSKSISDSGTTVSTSGNSRSEIINAAG